MSLTGQQLMVCPSGIEGADASMTLEERKNRAKAITRELVEAENRLILANAKVLEAELERDGAQADIDAKNKSLDDLLDPTRPEASRAWEAAEARTRENDAGTPTPSVRTVAPGLSVRQAILRFFEAQPVPVTQEMAEEVLERAGYPRTTIHQTLYDLSSSKSETLSREGKGLTITQKGRDAINR